MKKKERENKTTSEKPVSLHPLKFDEALKVLLKAPLPKEEKDESKKPTS